MQCCVRCGRQLNDPISIDRALGPVCYAKSGGGIFNRDLEADEKEWERREELLKNGGEIDLGVNWDYPDPGNLIRGCFMRISVRFRDGAFEAYGHVYKPGREAEEVIFARGTDIKTVYRAAVVAGPISNAQAHRARQNARKKLKRAV
jgi:hypothetical protein